MDGTRTADGGGPPVPFEVAGRRDETADTVTIELVPPPGTAPLAFRPGQFNMLYAFGLGEAAISIAGNGERADRWTHTVRRAGAVTGALATADVGTSLGVRGPFGGGWPVDRAEGRDVLLVAGGLGLPPLRPALLELLRRRGAFGRIELVYGARTPADLVYPGEVDAWRHRSDLRVQVTVDRADRTWVGDVGVVTARLPDARVDPARLVAFLCGPEIMMTRTAQALLDRGTPPEAIWLSMERNMKCAVGLCGHCQFGPTFLCRDGPVLRYDRVRAALGTREL